MPRAHSRRADGARRSIPEQRLKRITSSARRPAPRHHAAGCRNLLRRIRRRPLMRSARDRKPGKAAAAESDGDATRGPSSGVGGALRVALSPARRPPRSSPIARSICSCSSANTALVPGMSVADLEEFGERLAGLLLPPEIVEALPSVKSSPLVVVHDTASAHWPWETLSIKGWAPAAASGLSRRYAAEGMSVAKWREQRRRSREFNVLLVINPTGDLPGASGGSALPRADAASGSGIRRSARRRDTPRLLRNSAQAIRHDPLRRQPVLSGGASASGICARRARLRGADLAAMIPCGALFFNSCESGRLLAPHPSGSSTAASLRRAFLRVGVANSSHLVARLRRRASAFASTLTGISRRANPSQRIDAPRPVRALPSAGDTCTTAARLHARRRSLSFQSRDVSPGLQYSDSVFDCRFAIAATFTELDRSRVFSSEACDC